MNKSRNLYSVTLSNGNKIQKRAYSRAQFKQFVFQSYGIKIYDSMIDLIHEVKKLYAIQAKKKSAIYMDACAHELALRAGQKDLD